MSPGARIDYKTLRQINPETTYRLDFITSERKQNFTLSRHFD